MKVIKNMVDKYKLYGAQWVVKSAIFFKSVGYQSVNKFFESDDLYIICTFNCYIFQ